MVGEYVWKVRGTKIGVDTRIGTMNATHAVMNDVRPRTPALIFRKSRHECRFIHHRPQSARPQKHNRPSERVVRWCGVCGRPCIHLYMRASCQKELFFAHARPRGHGPSEPCPPIPQERDAQTEEKPGLSGIASNIPHPLSDRRSDGLDGFDRMVGVCQVVAVYSRYCHR